MLCVNHRPWVRGGARPHACSHSLRGFVCDTWLTEGAGDQLVRGDVLPVPRAPHPRPLHSLLGLPVASPRGQQTAANARHTFYLPKLGRKFQPFSLLSGRAFGRQKVGLQSLPGTDSRDAGGEKKPSLERKITGRRAPPGGC